MVRLHAHTYKHLQNKNNNTRAEPAENCMAICSKNSEKLFILIITLWNNACFLKEGDSGVTPLLGSLWIKDAFAFTLVLNVVTMHPQAPSEVFCRALNMIHVWGDNRQKKEPAPTVTYMNAKTKQMRWILDTFPLIRVENYDTLHSHLILM